MCLRQQGNGCVVYHAYFCLAWDLSLLSCICSRLFPMILWANNEVRGLK